MAVPFRLSRLPALSRAAVDREEGLRGDTERLRSRWSRARVLPLDSRGRAPVPYDGSSAAGTLALRPATSFGSAPPDDAIFLGTEPGSGTSRGIDYWALTGRDAADGRTVTMPGRFGVPVENVLADGELWVGLREHGALLDDAGAGLFTTALALRNWHRRTRFCAVCGGANELAKFGWVARCTACDREEYPRTDPAVICLVHDDEGVNGERVLLARQPYWPEGGYSVLAGFVEAGESLEGCVVREVAEEVGVDVRDVRYLGSQPWPFPRSIMLGFAARADAAQAVVPAAGEIADARWFTRRQVLAALDGEGELRLPGNSSIARVMLFDWAVA
ncbi:NAD(+) diphosphatase [Haloechinothrix sp. LS1_15]|uniref:NAD(+) diphosphatase n=1 Tax=Haloechinothrix sp. LS1_15 TaxID=2652248 RepID=UPI002947A3B8|nr:NAD(+) diphosphatase [Haloechinothrix sp. LS1_15]MDV6013830.1 NAD(+) diphosphatase [Haloechinothrix sp. LS1_15]